MKNMTRIFCTVLALACSTLIGGCASAGHESAALYDLGPFGATQAPSGSTSTLPPISIAEVHAPAWLDSQRMFYRLNYDNAQQPQSYAASRWAMPPAQLFLQRLRSSLAQAGGVVVPASDGALNLPVLRLEVDDFSQTFDDATHSSVLVAIRASLFDGRILRAQKTFIRKNPAASADARGGAVALANASDVIIHEMTIWLANLPAKK